jgi:rhodanese-related sulfurtransferase
VQYRLDVRSEHIAPADVVALNGELVLIDLRDQTEFEAGHAPGATPIAMDTIERGWRGADARLPFVIVCRNGELAGRAAHLLRERGRDAFAVHGGMLAWATDGQPLVTNSGTRPQVL